MIYKKQALLFICILVFTCHVYGEEPLECHLNSSPIFTYNGDVLFSTLNASYTLYNRPHVDTYYKFDAPLTNPAVVFGYQITTVKYEGSNIKSSNPWVLPNICNYSTPNGLHLRGYLIEESSFGGHGPAILDIATSYPDVDEYFTNTTEQGEISVNYYIFDSHIEEITPIIINLGNWPSEIRYDDNQYKIEDILNKNINSDKLDILGRNLSLIVNKGDWGYDNFNYDKYLSNHSIIQHSVFSESNPYFNYRFSKSQGNYYLLIQRPSPLQNGTLFFRFRPVKTDYKASIELPYVNDYTNKHQIEVKFQENLNNANISNFKFTYTNLGFENTTYVEPIMEGIYEFDEKIDTKQASPFLYPYEAYISTIQVTPPLLVSDSRNDISLSDWIAKDFTASLNIEYDQITIKLIKTPYAYAIYLFNLFLVILGAISVSIKKGETIGILALISSVAIFTLSNGFKYGICLGNIALFGCPIVIYLVIKKYKKIA